MDFNRLTIKSGEAGAADPGRGRRPRDPAAQPPHPAGRPARRRGRPGVSPEPLCIALLDQELPRTLVERAGESVDSLRAECEAKPAQKPAAQGSSPQPDAPAAFGRVLDKAEEEMRELEDEYVSTEHLLLALDVAPRDRLLSALKDVRGPQRVKSQDPGGSHQAPRESG